jgi:hypothetical protein
VHWQSSNPQFILKTVLLVYPNFAGGPLLEIRLCVERARFLQVGRWRPILRIEQGP